MSGDVETYDAEKFEIDRDVDWDPTEEMTNFVWAPETTLRCKADFPYLDCPVVTFDCLWEFLAHHNLFSPIPVIRCIYDTYTPRVYDEDQELLNFPHHRVTHRVVEFPIFGHVRKRDLAPLAHWVTYASHRMLHRYMHQHRSYYTETINLSDTTSKIYLSPVYGLEVSINLKATHDVDWGVAILHTLDLPLPSYDMHECVGGFVSGDPKSPTDLRSLLLQEGRQVQRFHRGQKNLDVSLLRNLVTKYFPEPVPHVTFRGDVCLVAPEEQNFE